MSAEHGSLSQTRVERACRVLGIIALVAWLAQPVAWAFGIVAVWAVCGVFLVAITLRIALSLAPLLGVRAPFERAWYWFVGAVSVVNDLQRSIWGTDILRDRVSRFLPGPAADLAAFIVILAAALLLVALFYASRAFVRNVWMGGHPVGSARP